MMTLMHSITAIWIGSAIVVIALLIILPNKTFHNDDDNEL
jgi:hypothetical protein